MPLPPHHGVRPKRDHEPTDVDCDAGRAAGCGTWCCRTLVVHLAGEDRDDGLEPEPGFHDIIRRDDEGACAYLGPDDRCTVWEKRPLDCRMFTCEGRECPAVLRPRGAGPLEPDPGPPLDERPCDHCGERAGYVAHFLLATGRIRCASCGGPFLPRIVHGMRPRVRPGPALETEFSRRVHRAEIREYLGDAAGAREDYLRAVEAGTQEEAEWAHGRAASIRLRTKGPSSGGVGAAEDD